MKRSYLISLLHWYDEGFIPSSELRKFTGLWAYQFDVPNWR